MEKDTFQLHFNVDTQITYVKKVCDEQTKNHKETNVEIQSGIIPQVLDVNGQTINYVLLDSMKTISTI